MDSHRVGNNDVSFVQAAVEMAATLLHCKVSELVAALSTRRIRAGGDDIVQRLTHAQVILHLIIEKGLVL